MDFESTGTEPWRNDDPFYQPFGGATTVAAPVTAADIFDTPPTIDVFSTAKPTSLTGNEPALQVTIGEPEKHGDGMDPYITYQITTNTTQPHYTNRTATVRRRYQDFVWLYNQLVKEFPPVIVPPLPEKNRLAYLDRFDQEFIEKRQAALQRFLNRVAAHPQLQKSDNLRAFLEQKIWGFETAKQLKKSAMLEDISDAVINAFAKVKHPDERFTAIQEYIQSLETHLTSVEKLYLRIMARQQDLSEDLTDTASSLTLLSATEETMSTSFRAVGQAFEKVSTALRQLNDKLEGQFSEQIHDYILYCEGAKHVLKGREQKQIEYEELLEYLEGKVTERDELMAPGGGKSSNWMSNLPGIKPEDPQVRLEKLNEKIKEAQAEVEDANEIHQQFSKLVLQEMDLFNRSKTVDFKKILTEYIQAHIDFMRKALTAWKEARAVLDSTSL